MPKLLRKDIYVTSLISFVGCSIICIMNFFRLSNSDTFEAIFNSINLFVWILTNPSIEAKLFRFSLPDYIFIAPYSKEQRKGLLKKGMLYKFSTIFINVFLLIICPLLVKAILLNNILQIVRCIILTFILFTLIYSGLFTSYISKVNYGMELLIEALRLYQFCMFGGVGAFENKMVDALIGASVIIAEIVVIFLCRSKYYEAMIGYLSDYERSREIKLMRYKK